MSKGMVKAKNGLIEKMDFAMGVQAPWFSSPSDAIITTATEGGIQMGHSVVDTSILKPITQDRCVIDIKNNFNPLNASERAIISIFENEDTSMEVEEYFDSVQGTAEAYPYIRIIKDYNSYQFLWSDDGKAWNFVGAMDVSMISPFLKICLLGGGDLDYILNSVTIYESTILKVRNLSVGQKVEVWDDSNNKISEKLVTFGKNYADVDVSKIENPFNGTIKIYDTDLTTLIYDSGVQQYCGGDTFNYLFALTLFNETDAVINPESESFLGSLDGLSVERKFRLLNNNPITILNAVAKITQKDGRPDYNYVDVAEDISGVPGTYSKTLSFGDFLENDERYFWLKIQRNTTDSLQDNCIFNLEISTD